MKKEKKKISSYRPKSEISICLYTTYEQRNTTELNVKICLEVLCDASFAWVHKKKLFL